MSAPTLTRITAQDAENDPPEGRTFTDRPAAVPAAQFPRRSYAISVQSPAGFPITITYNDMTIDRLDEALGVLLERGYMPAEVPSVLTPPNAPAPATQPATSLDQPICPYRRPHEGKHDQGQGGDVLLPEENGRRHVLQGALAEAVALPAMLTARGWKLIIRAHDRCLRFPSRGAAQERKGRSMKW
jgi:hypothetical protein